MGTHHSAWAPGPWPCATTPTSTPQAGAGCAATAAADDLQLTLSTVGPLQEFLDELLQAQLGTGLPRCCLLQELVNLYHLPGTEAVFYSRASAWLTPTFPCGEIQSTAALGVYLWPHTRPHTSNPITRHILLRQKHKHPVTYGLNIQPPHIGTVPGVHLEPHSHMHIPAQHTFMNMSSSCIHSRHILTV